MATESVVGIEEQKAVVAEIVASGADLICDWIAGGKQRTRHGACGDDGCGYSSCRLAKAIARYAQVSDARDTKAASVRETLQSAVDEIAALRLMSYTGGQPDLSEEDVMQIRALLIDLAVLLAQATGMPWPEPGPIL